MAMPADQSNLDATTGTSPSTDKDWWRGAVIYQIYPRSFQDSNSDGIGDLAGITNRLSHIASLGADAVWISPFFKSPMKDFGYDVSDYRAVDPMFGDLQDFDKLISEAHDLGLKIMIDLVLSHTSDQHPWFQESCSSHDNDKHDWYVWADARPDGTAPNNWLSIFGGPGWTWHTTRCQYYQNNFLSSQPDLNFHNTDVQDALLDVVRFWLDRGVDGFRLDTINFYFCDKQLRSNPALASEERNASIAPAVNPYNHQDHLYDKNRPENLVFLERFRALLDEYPAAAAVGEVGDAQYGMQILNDYTQGNNRVHMCYTFEMLSPARPQAQMLADMLAEFEKNAPDSWICWAFSNHDVVRHASRWSVAAEHQQQYLKFLCALLMSMRGSVCIYQGEELGLPEAELRFEDLQDPYGIRFWPSFKGRDGCRTPMVWDTNEVSAGFSKAKPWLPVPDEHQALAVSGQTGNAESLLEHYRRFLAFRGQHSALRTGALSHVQARQDVLSFERSNADGTLLCVFNFADQNVQIPLTEFDGANVQLLDTPGFGCELNGSALKLPPYSAAYLRV